MSRRVHISKDLLKQSVHYHTQYFENLIIWGTKAASTLPPGENRDKFSDGLHNLFAEIQSLIAKEMELLGETPNNEEIKKLIESPEYQALVDKAKVQSIMYAMKVVSTPRGFLKAIKMAFDKALSSTILFFLKAFRRSK